MFRKNKRHRVHEYLPAPTFDLVPPPDGPLQLGQILDDPSEPRYPLNLDDVVSPLDSKSYTHTADGISARRSQLDKKEFKLWARLTELMPIGADADVTKDQSCTDLFSIGTVETTYFLPSKKYLDASVKAEDVGRFLEGGLWRPSIYMITEIKIACIASITSYASRREETSAAASADFKQLGVPLTTGASVGKLAASDEVTHISNLKPFILGYQARRIIYKKGTPATTAAHNDGAMFGNDSSDTPGAYENVVVEGLEDTDRGDVADLDGVGLSDERGTTG